MALHAADRGERGFEARARQLLGDVASLDEPIQAADTEGHYRAALVIAAGLGMRPLVARCHQSRSWEAKVTNLGGRPHV